MHKHAVAMAIRSLLGEPLNRTNRPPEKTAAAVHAVAARIEVEAPRVVAIRVRHGRPVVADRTGTAERSPIAVATAGEEDAVDGEFCLLNEDALKRRNVFDVWTSDDTEGTQESHQLVAYFMRLKTATLYQICGST